jgi:DNA repair exonuclease SbcCD nuclease subunit
MRFIHCADLHLGSKMESYLPQAKADTLKRELLAAFSSMVDYAKENKIEYIVIAGDMFDARRVLRRAQKYALGVMREAPEVTFLYFKGNHDAGFDFGADALPENLKIFDSPSWQYFSPEGENFTFAGISSLESEQTYEALSLDEKCINVVVLHGQTASGVGEDKINLRLLKKKGIDYLALGHIHASAVEGLDKRGTYAYSGCLAGRGFDECGDKGFLVVDIDENKKSDRVSVEFVKSKNVRGFYTVSVDLGGTHGISDSHRALDEALADVEGSSAIKVVLCGELDEDALADAREIERYLEGRFFFVKVVDKTKIFVSAEKYQNDVSLRGEFVRLAQNAKMNAETRDLVLRYGLSALKGERGDV